MKKFLLLLALFTSSVLMAEGLEPGAWYVGASGGMLLPGNGTSLRRGAETSVWAGRYIDEDVLALDVVAHCAPNVWSHDENEALSGAGLRLLYHLRGFEAFDKLFGCERFDPYIFGEDCVRFGARHVFADDSHRTALGHAIGLGAFYHLTDTLDLRFDSQAMYFIDSPCGMLYSVSVGLQWSFGGSAE